MAVWNDSAYLAYCETIRSAYREAAREPDDWYPVWPGRATFDYATGALSWPASCAKHLDECRDALGLPRPPMPPIQTLPRLVPKGQFFALESGERFTATEASDFNLLNRWQNEGEHAAAPIAEQRALVGYRMLRVWTLFDIPGIGRFLNIDYARVRDFLAFCSRWGLYVEFTAYTSIERHDHWDQLVAACQGSTNVILELVNEGDLPVNRIDLSRYARPLGVLASHGSASSETIPPWEPWDYGTLHYNDASEWQRKTAHNPMEDFADVHQRPAMANENTRFCDRDASTAHAYDAAAGAALLTAGAAYHSVSGKSSVLWAGPELDAARAWADGANSVPLEFQAGRYVHRIDMEGPNDLRVYQRILPDGRAWTVRIRK